MMMMVGEGSGTYLESFAAMRMMMQGCGRNGGDARGNVACGFGGVLV